MRRAHGAVDPFEKVHPANHEEFTHGLIQFTEKSRKCLASTREIGRDVGQLLRGRSIEVR